MSAARPRDLTRTDKSDVRLMDHRRRRERVAGSFAGQMNLGLPAELVIDQRKQAICGRFVTIGHRPQENRGVFVLHGVSKALYPNAQWGQSSPCSRIGMSLPGAPAQEQ